MIIPTIRPLVYLHPYLFKGASAQTSEGKNAKKERGRRDMERMWFEELSRYYQLPVGSRDKWTRPQLLSKGKHNLTLSLLMASHLPDFLVLEDLEGLENIPDIPGLADELP